MITRYQISNGDFTNAGNVASSVKKILKDRNIDHNIIKKIVVAIYEAEVNVVAHAYSGVIETDISQYRIRVLVSDKGPGIADIPQAMQEGYSTASDAVREMGFGAGMGLSNMKKNSDIMNITSKIGEGTTVELITFFEPNIDDDSF